MQNNNNYNDFPTFDIESPKSTVLYIDANNLFYRAYHAANRNGEEGNKGLVLHSLTSMIYRIKTQIPHRFAYAVFDGETSRDSRLELYPEYKANRESKNELAEYKNDMEELLKILNITSYTTSTIEADDVIGILGIKSAIEKKNDVIILTSDKDYKQLCAISDKIHLLNSMSNTLTNNLNFEEINDGLKSEQVIDFLSLMGDVSDNIPGVPKVGKVTALKLLKEHGSIEGIKKNIESMKDGVVKNNLIEHINNGSLDRNYDCIEMHLDRFDCIDFDFLRKNTIDNFKNEIIVKDLADFLKKHSLNNFLNKNIQPIIDMNYTTIRINYDSEPVQNNVNNDDLKKNYEPRATIKPTEKPINSNAVNAYRKAKMV